jgi:hypothetical protein
VLRRGGDGREIERLGDRAARLGGDASPAARRRVDRRREREPCDQPRLARDLQQRVEERHVVDEGRRGIRRAVGARIAERDRLHRHAGLDRRFEERRVEPAERPPVGRRAFRKHGHRLAGLQRARDACLHARGVADVGALEEDRVEPGGDAAADRPPPRLRLRDEAERPDGVQDLHVEPRHVIRDDQHGAVRGCGATRLQPDAHHRQHARREAPDEPLPARGADPRRDQARDDPHEEERADDADEAARHGQRVRSRRSSCSPLEALGEAARHPLHRQHHDDVGGAERRIPGRRPADDGAHPEIAADERRVRHAACRIGAVER